MTWTHAVWIVQECALAHVQNPRQIWRPGITRGLMLRDWLIKVETGKAWKLRRTKVVRLRRMGLDSCRCFLAQTNSDDEARLQI